MKTFEGITFARSLNGYRRYIREIRGYYRFRERYYRCQDFAWRYSLEDTMEIEKIIALDNKFMALTTDDEKAMIDYISYHNPDVPKPYNFEKSFYSAFPKWLSVFFNTSEPLFGRIDPVLLGKQIQYLRFINDTKQAELASMIHVDRTTLIDLELGKRIPSLETIYRLSVVFKIGIDELVKQSVVRNVFDINFKKSKQENKR